MRNARQFVFRYEGDAKTEEVVQDFDGEIPLPERDAVITRNGKQWKVAAVMTEQLLGNPPALPVHRIFLTKAN